MLIRNLIQNSGCEILIKIYLIFVFINATLFTIECFSIFYKKFNKSYVVISCPEPTKSIIHNFLIIRPRIKAFYCFYNYHLNKKLTFKLLIKSLKTILLLGVILDIFNLTLHFIKSHYSDINVCHNDLWPYDCNKRIIIVDGKFTRNGPYNDLNRRGFNLVSDNLLTNQHVNYYGVWTNTSVPHAIATSDISNLGGGVGTSDKYSKYSYMNFNNFEGKNIKLYNVKFNREEHINTVAFRKSITNGDVVEVNDVKAILPFDDLSTGLKSTMRLCGGNLVVNGNLSALLDNNSIHLSPNINKKKPEIIITSGDKNTQDKALQAINDMGGVDNCKAYKAHWDYSLGIYNRAMLVGIENRFFLTNGVKLTESQRIKSDCIIDEILLDKRVNSDGYSIIEHDRLLDFIHNSMIP